MNNITILKAKETEWLINKVEENLTRLSEKSKDNILNAVGRRLGASASSIKIAKTSLPIKQKQELTKVLKGISYDI